MTNAEKIEIIKRETKENPICYFEPTDFEYYLAKNNGNINNTIYEMLILKSEDMSLNISGLSTKDTSSYFKRLASRYKPYNSGILKGG